MLRWGVRTLSRRVDRVGVDTTSFFESKKCNEPLRYGVCPDFQCTTETRGKIALGKYRVEGSDNFIVEVLPL